MFCKFYFVFDNNNSLEYERFPQKKSSISKNLLLPIYIQLNNLFSLFYWKRYNWCDTIENKIISLIRSIIDPHKADWRTEWVSVEAVYLVFHKRDVYRERGRPPLGNLSRTWSGSLKKGFLLLVCKCVYINICGVSEPLPPFHWP